MNRPVDYEPELTHYTAYFTQNLRGATSQSQKAVCGAYILPTEHTSEPTCPQCLAYLQAEAEDEQAIADALGVTLENGMYVPKEHR